MDLIGVRVEMPANTPVVVLREREGRQRTLPIVIGTPEASAIHAALSGVMSPRPLTHDLMVTIIGDLDATVEQVAITTLRDHIFYAEVHLRVAEEVRIVSSRPSDAIAIAARVGCPIVASEALLAEAGQVPPAPTADAEAIIDEFRDFLDDLNPDDFRGG